MYDYACSMIDIVQLYHIPKLQP